MAHELPRDETRRIFVLPLPDFPLYYLPRSRKIVSCVLPPEPPTTPARPDGHRRRSGPEDDAR